MAYYRLYFLDRAGHIQHFREFEGSTDAAALRQSEEWREERLAMELWSCRRRVASWPALGLAPEALARASVSALRLAAR